MKNRVVRTSQVATILFAAVLLPAGLANAQGAAEKTYKAKCMACHGTDGSGNTPAGKKLGAHDFRSPDITKMSDVELMEILSKGKNKMPGYEKSLKEFEIKDLVAYVRELGKKK
jgi:mono/diheme cytochrome c family protein